jgi:hypothetical protein
MTVAFLSKHPDWAIGIVALPTVLSLIWTVYIIFGTCILLAVFRNRDPQKFASLLFSVSFSLSFL